MQINIIEKNGEKLASVESEEEIVASVQDILDIMANCDYSGSRKIIMNEKNFIAVFFDLKTGFAGDILQKFSNYDASIAIIGDFSKYKSKSLKDFIYEVNKGGRINFVDSKEKAIDALTRK